MLEIMATKPEVSTEESETTEDILDTEMSTEADTEAAE